MKGKGKGRVKACKGCGKDLPLSEFNKRASALDGFRPTCRVCDRYVRVHGERPGVGAGHPPPVPAPAPAPVLPEPPTITPKVIGEIKPQGGAFIKESVVEDEAIKKAQEEYADILNRRLPVKRRAAILVKIAMNAKGANAALALKALQDINLATQVITRTGAQIDLGPLFSLPDGSDVSVRPGK